MSRYNIEKIIRVDLITKKEADNYKYIPAKKILGIFKQEAYIKGYYSVHPVEFFKENYDGYTVEDGVVYWRPAVIIKYHNDITMRKYFDTDHEARLYRDEITNKFKWIED